MCAVDSVEMAIAKMEKKIAAFADQWAPDGQKDRSICGRLDRSHAQHTGRQFDVAIDSRVGRSHACSAGVTDLTGKRAIADNETEVRTVGSRYAYRPGLKDSDFIAVPAIEFLRLHGQRVQVHPVDNLLR